MKAFGKKMYASHEGLSKLYEVSCEELDFLVDESRELDFVAGARMMGGGFGGCTINLVGKTKVDQFIRSQHDAYVKKFNHEMNAYIVAIKNGTSVLNLSDVSMNTIL
jgi:galactokinase